MTKRLTEIEAKEKINNLLSPNTEFIGWKEGTWEGLVNTAAIFYCKKHKIQFERSCKLFSKSQKRKDGTQSEIKCDECNKENKRKHSHNTIVDEKTVEDLINNFITINQHLELVEFKYNKIAGDSIIRIKCKKHSTIIQINYSTIKSFVTKNRIWHCPQCTVEIIKTRNRLTAEEAQDAVNRKFKGTNLDLGYDYSLVKDTFTSTENTVTLVCPKHGKFQVKYRSLMCKDCIGLCPECEKEKSRYTTEEASNKIKEVIKQKNIILGSDIEFLGFINGKWEGETTKLILKCNKHNRLWNTTSFSSMLKEGLIGCPVCSSIKRISNKEELCYNEISKYIEKDIIKRQYSIKIFDNIINRYRTIHVDFFIESLNLIIEYDGEQHFEFIPFMFRYDYNYWYSRQVLRDICLSNYCSENKINLFRISYRDIPNLSKIVKVFFLQNRDITTKINPILLPIKYEGGLIK